LTADSDYARDVAFNKDGDAIVASRFVFQARNLSSLDDSKSIMLSLRELFASEEFQQFNLTSYHPLYKFGEQASKPIVYKSFLIQHNKNLN
jgi:hypothetical protein